MASPSTGGTIAQVGSQIGAGAASGAASGGPVGAAIGAATAAVKAAIQQLAQHSLRLKDAKNENASIPPVVAAFDADVAAIASAYNSGGESASTCILAAQTVYQSIMANMKAAITQPNGQFIPGTSWDEATGVAGKCNKICTAGCCVFYGDLGPVLSMMIVAMGGQGYYWKTNDPRYKANPGGGATITVPEVFASKYGGQDRQSYTIVITPPPLVHEVQAGLFNTLASITGTANPTSGADTFVEKLAGSSGGGVSGSAPTAGLLGGSGNTVLIVVAGMFLFLALLLVAKR